VPNSLLGILGQRSFKVDEIPNKPTIKLQGQMPLIVITTNEERELPAAFVRRCVVLNLNPPDGEEPLRVWLKERVEAHADLVAKLAPGIVDHALTQVLADRRVAHGHGYPKVGLAEALDLLTALAEITQDVPHSARTEQQRHWLNRISAYALVKHAGDDHGQSRDPVPFPGPDDDVHG
jgi:MoxR-like ATPase